MNTSSLQHKLIVPFLTLLLFIIFSVTACAEGMDTPENDPAVQEYQTIAQFSASLSITGNSAKCIGRVTLKDHYSGTLTVTLQRKTGNSWVDITSWRGEVPAGHYKKVEGTFTLSISGTYRVKANLVSGSEDEDTFSFTKSY